jgi:hypothetical protein
MQSQQEIRVLPLKTIAYDERARNGYWCTLPYPGHKKGCPKFPSCPKKQADFLSLKAMYDWSAVFISFDLKTHAERMQAKHAGWSRRQARCVLYWQAKIVHKLRLKAYSLNSDIVLECPEASGVNLFVTMAQAGINLKPNPELVRKIFLVGWYRG